MVAVAEHYYLVATCVGLNGYPQASDWLHDMYDHDREITYRTFRHRVPAIAELAAGMGYFRNKRRGLTLAKDWHVRFYRSKFRGRVCYHFVHSEIDYIFQTEPMAEGN